MERGTKLLYYSYGTPQGEVVTFDQFTPDSEILAITEEGGFVKSPWDHFKLKDPKAYFDNDLDKKPLLS